MHEIWGTLGSIFQSSPNDKFECSQPTEDNLELTLQHKFVQLGKYFYHLNFLLIFLNKNILRK